MAKTEAKNQGATATAPAEEKLKRKLHRSPNYPAFSLEEGLQKIRTVYGVERRAWTTSAVIQKHLGHEKPSGSGGRAVSALRQYGLLEENNGQFRVSDDAYQILALRDGDEDRLKMLARSARKPVIFNEILTHYADELPSDQTLHSYLITKKQFNPTSVHDFIKIFRRTVAFGRLGDARSDGESGFERENHEMPSTTTPEPVASPVAPRQRARPNERFYAWDLSIPRNVRAELRIIGEELTEGDLDRLERQVEFLREALLEKPSESRK